MKNLDPQIKLGLRQMFTGLITLLNYAYIQVEENGEPITPKATVLEPPILEGPQWVVNGLQPKKRGRKSFAELQAAEQAATKAREAHTVADAASVPGGEGPTVSASSTAPEPVESLPVAQEQPLQPVAPEPAAPVVTHDAIRNAVKDYVVLPNSGGLDRAAEIVLKPFGAAKISLLPPDKLPEALALIVKAKEDLLATEGT